jgi:hypothetical protein
VLGKCLCAVVRQPVERRLRGKPVASGFFVEIRRALCQLAQGFTEDRDLVSGLGRCEPQALACQPRIRLADWTAACVEARLHEAADVMKRLPEATPPKEAMTGPYRPLFILQPPNLQRRPLETHAHGRHSHDREPSGVERSHPNVLAFLCLEAYTILARNARVEEDLVDQLFNSTEKRLARLLLLLANFGKEGRPEPVLAKISQETLAEMVGTTRSRVSHFMNKFRRLGFINYNGHLEVHNSLLGVLLADQPRTVSPPE